MYYKFELPRYLGFKTYMIVLKLMLSFYELPYVQWWGKLKDDKSHRT